MLRIPKESQPLQTANILLQLLDGFIIGSYAGDVCQNSKALYGKSR